MNIINPYRFGVATTPIPLENIISEYKFENNVLDTVGTNDGTATALTYADGLVNRTGVFNGSSSRVLLTDDNLVFGDGTTDVPFSISFLFKPDGTGWILSKYPQLPYNSQYWLTYSGTTLGFALNDYSQATAGIISKESFFTATASTWHHITATYDGSGLGTNINIYVDGVLASVSSTDNGVNYVAMENTGADLWIGAAEGTFNYLGTGIAGSFGFIDMDLDCLRFWDKELSQAEITEIATQELAGIDINPKIPLQNIISEYKFENNTLDTMGSNDGTPTDLTYASGLVGQTGVFNGTTSVVKMVGSASNLDFNGVDFSVSQLFKTTQELGFRLLQNRGQGALGIKGWQVSNSAGGTWSNVIIDSVSNGYIEMDNVPSNEDDNNWHHLVMTWNTSTGTCKLYIDGVLGGSKTLASLIGIDLNALDVCFGGSNTDGQLFNGSGDCARIWNKELSQAEITGLANNELNGIDINPSPTPIPYANIISEYKFEDNVLDTVGTNDGTATAITYADGLVNRTGVFANITSNVSIPHNSNLSFGNGTTDNPFSVSVLIKYTSLSNVLQFVFSKSGISDIREYDLLYYLGGLNFKIYSNQSLTDTINFNIVFTPTVGVWYHITVTYNGASGANMYINGINQTITINPSGNYIAMLEVSQPFLLGKSPTKTTYTLNGSMDCVRIWDKELSQAEVTVIAGRELAGIDINP